MSLFSLLGVSGEEEASALILRLKAELSAATGKEQIDEALASIRQNQTDLASLRTAVGASTQSEAIGRIHAASESSQRLRDAEAEINAMRKQEQDRTAEALMCEAISGPKPRSTPAMKPKMQELYAKHGLGALQAHIEALPLINNAPSEVEMRQPKVVESATEADELRFVRRIAAQLGEGEELVKQVQPFTIEPNMGDIVSINRKKERKFTGYSHCRTGSEI